MKLSISIASILLIIGITACQYERTDPFEEVAYSIPEFSVLDDDPGMKKGAIVDLEITPVFIDGVNEKLASRGEHFRVKKVETFTAAGFEKMGAEFYSQHVGNKQLPEDFLPNDYNRTWSGADPNQLTYAIDQVDAATIGGGLPAALTTAAIVRATETWDELICSDLGFTRNNDYGVDIGIIAWLNGLGGSPYVFADIQHCGFTDINFGPGIIGATFTFIWIDENGDPTDMDQNGKEDVAFREIYYDPSWIWQDSPAATQVDVESVALHELGHALSQAHFGTILIINDRKIQFAPRAVMNPVYIGSFRELLGSDIAGHASIWGNWPNL